MELTSEYFESARITISQPLKGHRYGEESLELAKFCRISDGERVCELGAGSGVISLCIAATNGASLVMGIEIQKELCDIATRNAKENSLSDRVHFVNADFRDFAKKNAGSFEHVVTNPPFYPKGSGRQSPDTQRAAARHELHGTIIDFLDAAALLLVPGGKLWMVFPTSRRTELMTGAKDRMLREAATAPSSHSTFLSEFSKIGRAPGS